MEKEKEKEEEAADTTKHQPQAEAEEEEEEEEEGNFSSPATTTTTTTVVIINIPPLPPPSSKSPSSHQQLCRVCHEEEEEEERKPGEGEEELIELGCLCRGGLSSAHRSCIQTWFRTTGSNRCEICREIAANVPPPLPPPQPHPNAATGGYLVWRVDPSLRHPDRQSPRGCSRLLWLALVILIGGLLLDVLLTITVGVSPLPLNIIIGVIIVLGLGTAVRMVLEFIQEWTMRRTPPRVDNAVNSSLSYHPTM